VAIVTTQSLSANESGFNAKESRTNPNSDSVAARQLRDRPTSSTIRTSYPLECRPAGASQPGRWIPLTAARALYRESSESRRSEKPRSNSRASQLLNDFEPLPQGNNFDPAVNRIDRGEKCLRLVLFPNRETQVSAGLFEVQAAEVCRSNSRKRRSVGQARYRLRASPEPATVPLGAPVQRETG
jgi:hypothetical protein